MRDKLSKTGKTFCRTLRTGSNTDIAAALAHPPKCSDLCGDHYTQVLVIYGQVTALLNVLSDHPEFTSMTDKHGFTLADRLLVMMMNHDYSKADDKQADMANLDALMRMGVCLSGRVTNGNVFLEAHRKTDTSYEPSVDRVGLRQR